MPNDEKLKELTKIYYIKYSELIDIRDWVIKHVDSEYQLRTFAKLLKRKYLEKYPHRKHDYF